MSETANTADGFEKCIPRSLYFTLSLYVPSSRVEAALGRRLDPAMVRSFQPGYRDSLRLRNGVEPLLNDISDRERLNAVDDFLLDTLCPPVGESLQMTVPATVKWKTEGRCFIATPPGLSEPRSIRVRRFWYTHANGAVAYHLSFRYDYAHTPGDFFFLTLLQKLAAPKEFEFDPAIKVGDEIRPTDSHTGLAPLDQIKVSASNGQLSTFWHYVRDTFNTDAADLFTQLRAHRPPAKVPKTISPTFAHLVPTAPFIEVPGLETPVSRLLFFFEDETFFRRLLPEIDPDTNKPYARSRMVQDQCFAPFQTRLAECERAPVAGVPQFHLDEAFWNWVVNPKPYYKQYEDDDEVMADPNRPLAMESRSREDCLQYLFLSGFNQNIVDFMNQDTSEILDSIDPIYPATEEQASERKFARYANPRALITFVEKARSLEAANDFIGTCAYAFMIHTVSMHNEFMTREYETSAFKLIHDVETLGKQGKLKPAAERFYSFRTGEYAAYHRDRYTNIFRYDTERDVFDSMMKLRGIERRNDYIERLISNLENQTRDREQRIKQDDDRLLTAGLGALGIFGFFQVAFDWAEKLKYFAIRENLPPMTDSPGVHFSPVPPFVHLPANAWQTPWDVFSAAMLYFSLAATIAGALFVAYLLLRGRLGNRK